MLSIKLTKSIDVVFAMHEIVTQLHISDSLHYCMQIIKHIISIIDLCIYLFTWRSSQSIRLLPIPKNSCIFASQCEILPIDLLFPQKQSVFDYKPGLYNHKSHKTNTFDAQVAAIQDNRQNTKRLFSLFPVLKYQRTFITVFWSTNHCRTYSKFNELNIFAFEFMWLLTVMGLNKETHIINIK